MSTQNKKSGTQGQSYAALLAKSDIQKSEENRRWGCCCRVDIVPRWHEKYWQKHYGLGSVLFAFDKGFSRHRQHRWMADGICVQGSGVHAWEFDLKCDPGRHPADKRTDRRHHWSWEWISDAPDTSPKIQFQCGDRIRDGFFIRHGNGDSTDTGTVDLVATPRSTNSVHKKWVMATKCSAAKGQLASDWGNHGLPIVSSR